MTRNRAFAVGALMAAIAGSSIGLLAFGAASSLQDHPEHPRDRTQQPPDSGARDAAATIANWPEVSKRAANAMIQKYGQPKGVTPDSLVWTNNGPWVRTIVLREPIPHHFPMEHEDCLEQFINYKVPADKFDELAEYDGSVICERTAGWLSARCDKEEANFLALNLADKIITGKMSVKDARAEYAKSVMAMMKGQTPEIMQGLQFSPATGGTGDPDKPMKMQ